MFISLRRQFIYAVSGALLFEGWLLAFGGTDLSAIGSARYPLLAGQGALGGIAGVIAHVMEQRLTELRKLPKPTFIQALSFMGILLGGAGAEGGLTVASSWLVGWARGG